VLNQGLCETSPIFSAFDDVLITIRHQVDALIDWIRALENARDFNSPQTIEWRNPSLMYNTERLGFFMATAEQLKALIRNHLNDQSDQFYTTALQVAAHEAKNGHTGLAYEIRSLVDKAKSRPNKIIQFTPDLSDLIISSEPMNRLSYLVSLGRHEKTN
jgi:hypothetical protein